MNMEAWSLPLGGARELPLQAGGRLTLACPAWRAEVWENQLLLEAWQRNKQVAVLAPDGGLISNLKGWENVVLPLLYHRHDWHPAEVEQTLQNWLRLLEVPEPAWVPLFAAVPGRLSRDERALLAWLRAALMQPDLVLLWRGLLDQMSEALQPRVLSWWRQSCAACVLLLDTGAKQHPLFEEGEHGRFAVD